MRRVITLCFACILCQCMLAYHWKGYWISTDVCQSEVNTWLNYQKTIELQHTPAQAMARIAADSKYWLWINDQLVVFEGGLKRGPNPKDTYYDEVDIAPFLKSGTNVLSLLVWYFGKQGFSHNSSGKAGLLFDCQAPGIEIVSDNSWGCAINTAYQTCADPKPNYRLSESNIRYNACEAPADAYKTKFITGMPKASMLEKAGGAPWNKLVKRPIPLWKEFGLKAYNKQYRRGDSLICELPYNAQVTPYLKIHSLAGKKIILCTDNYLFYNGDTENIRGEYITKEGTQEYESLGWMNGHKVYYLLPPGVEVIDVRYRETGYNTEFAGNFHSSDSLLNTLWTKSCRTLYVTMRDTYMDCPERERAQWTGDAVNQSGEAFYALSPSSHALAKKWLCELIDWQQADGSMYAPVPAGNWSKELPGQTLASVGYYGVWNYYLHTGDKQTLAYLYPSIKRYLDLWSTNSSGIINIRQVGWLWGDWGNNRDLLPLLNAWYYLALKGMHLSAIELGNSADAAHYSSQLDTLRTAFNNFFWTGTAYRDPAYEGKTDDRVQALAIVSGLASKETYKPLLKVFQQEQHASPYMEKYVFEAMMMMGEESHALNRHKQRMYAMVSDSNFTTLWEHWDVKASGFRSGTINHSWTGGGLTILSQYLCGIAPLLPGYKRVAILAQPGFVEAATAEVPSVKGKIKSAVSNTAKGFSLKAEIPTDIQGVIGAPTAKVKRILINGTEVWKNGKYIPNAIAQPYIACSSKHIAFIVTSGSYELNAIKQ